MSLRQEGSPKHPVRMRLLLLGMRFCLAAYLVGKDDHTLLGPGGRALRSIIAHTHTSSIILASILRDTSNLVGVGGQSLVMRTDAPDNAGSFITKYNYTLAGTDSTILERSLALHREQQGQLEQYFGELVQPTRYSITTLPLRWPFNTLTTICAEQAEVQDMHDIFSSDAIEAIAASRTVHKDLEKLARLAREWTRQDKWLDLVGPNNIVLTTESAEPHIRIIDTGLYAPEYLQDVNPVVGKPYREVFMDRLKLLESYARVSLFLIAVTCLVMHFHRINMLNTDFSDYIEDFFSL